VRLQKEEGDNISEAAEKYIWYIPSEEGDNISDAAEKCKLSSKSHFPTQYPQMFQPSVYPFSLDSDRTNSRFTFTHIQLRILGGFLIVRPLFSTEKENK